MGKQTFTPASRLFCVSAAQRCHQQSFLIPLCSSGSCLAAASEFPREYRSPLVPAPTTHWTDYSQHGCWWRRTQSPRKLRRDRRTNSHRETPKTQLPNTILFRCFYVLFSLVAIVLRLPFICFVYKSFRLSTAFLLYKLFFPPARLPYYTVSCNENQLYSGSIRPPIFTMTFLRW